MKLKTRAHLRAAQDNYTLNSRARKLKARELKRYQPLRRLGLKIMHNFRRNKHLLDAMVARYRRRIGT